jgi:hypothetical protein
MSFAQQVNILVLVLVLVLVAVRVRVRVLVHDGCGAIQIRHSPRAHERAPPVNAGERSPSMLETRERPRTANERRLRSVAVAALVESRGTSRAW